MDLKKLYYFIICLVSLFVLLWGVVDLGSSLAGISTSKVAAPYDQSMVQDNASEQSLDVYYQRKMFNDQLAYSLARIIVAGLVFVYSRMKVEKA